MRPSLSRSETLLLLACAALAAVAVLAPGLAQPPQLHGYADQRTLWGLPHAMDVLSNLPFALAGAAGLWATWRARRAVSNMQRATAALFFAGLLVTALGSSWYHLRPDDAGLAVDRHAMSLAFAGLLGLCAAGRVSERAGAALALGVLLLGPLAVQAWATSGNVLPWALLQFGGIALLVWLAALREPHGALPIRWMLVLLAYAAAKLLEVNDHAVYALTGDAVSGHSLKHVVAAGAALPVLSALWRAPARVQNRAGIAIAQDAALPRTHRA